MFNYDIISMWATHEAFNLEQRLHIIELIEKRYLIEREKHPDIFIYDLSQFFVSLREHVCSNCVAESGEGRYSQTRLERVEELKEQIQQLNQIINEKSEEIEKLKAGHTPEMQALKDRITLLTTDAKTRGMTMPQQVLAFYYLFNELGISFNNSDKTQWARFINTFTGKNFQNIRTELNIDFESRKTQKNLRIVADLFAELFPRIQQKVINDSQI